MSTIWFTSDLHLGHQRVAEYRGFANAEEHDWAVMMNWRRVVKPDDHVWVLGDLCLRDVDYALDCVSNLPGSKSFIAGNHDPVHPMHRTARKWQAKYLTAFDSVQPFARTRINGRDVLMSHFPYSADRGEQRYPQYRLPDLGEYLLHGHTHGPERLHDAVEIHVGLDAWDLTPVSLSDVARLINHSEAWRPGDAPIQSLAA